MEVLFGIVGLIMGTIVVVTLGTVGIITWGVTVRARAQARQREIEELKARLARLEADLEALKDQVAELIIEAHDGALLRLEEPPTPIQRLRPE